MGYRLQVMVSDRLYARLKKVAERWRMAPAAFARRAIERALITNSSDDPVTQLETLNAPSGDIDQVLSEIDAGRR